jgi:biopolymer transport protein TolR
MIGPQRSQLRSDINVTPLVDVVLVLLIIFMTIPSLLQSGYAVQIPTPRPRKTAADQPIVVSVHRDGSVFFDEEPLPLRWLPERLSRALRGQSSRTVVFAADDDVGYGEAIAVLDVLRTSGARIAIAP